MSAEVFVVSAVRTAVARARRGALSQTLPHVFGAAAVTGALERVPELPVDQIDDVILGCAMPEGEQGLNIGRQIALHAGLPQSVAGMTVNRFCASGLQAIAAAHATIAAGQAQVMLAGGVESMTLLPMEGLRFVPDGKLSAVEPNVYISMGLTAERVASEHKISREDQDAFALQSHQRALAALDAGSFADELVPVSTQRQTQRDGQVSIEDVTFETDEGPRRDCSAEGLERLRPAFVKGGTVTAGNSSQTSDGAAAALLLSGARCQDLGLEPLARLASFAVSGVAPEVMGIGPVHAIPKALAQAGVTLGDIGVIELNEAFASQSLACMRALDLDPARTNVHGGAIALGHPLGCTGAKLTATLLHELQRRKLRWGLVSMCVGGGMGAAAVFENQRN
ncbi:MAG: acetyl-CoA C-acyltransferase [Planctomycetota bacterium]|nr:MAG: acetyl-CoA C-acyltransferase [Planctomycetota bacterium]